MELQHHGIRGMRWGVRRFRNDDGSLTSAGKKRYNDSKKEEGSKKKSPSSIIKEKAKQFKDYNISLLEAFKEGMAEGRAEVDRQIVQNQLATQQFNDWAMRETTRAAINAGNQAASLGMSGGTNPFMFGMM